MSRDAGPQIKRSKSWWRGLSKDWSNSQFRNGYRRSLRSDYKLNPYKRFTQCGDVNPNQEFAHKWNRRVLKKKILRNEFDQIDDL